MTTDTIIEEKVKSDEDLQPGKKEFLYCFPQLVNRDDPILKSSLIYTDVEDKARFARELQTCCEMLGGVGLSANQIGVNNRIFSVSMDGYSETFFNPQIINFSEEKNNFTEGCLTYPGIFIDIKRPQSIMLKYINVNGEEKQSMFNGVTARIIQHEYDHMDGKNFLLYASPLKKAMAIKKAAKKGYKYINL